MERHFIPETRERIAADRRRHMKATFEEIPFEDDDPLGEHRLPSGWWILPFAASGLIVWSLAIVGFLSLS